MASDSFSIIGGAIAGGIAGSTVAGAAGAGIGQAIGAAMGGGQSFGSILNQAVQGDTIKDWDHASKLYVGGNYELAPKNTFLYHVAFDINPSAKRLNGMDIPLNHQDLGMMVKQVSLPKFSIQTHTFNAYNRPHINQTGIKYNPVNIVFHDDSADIARNFWFDYYSYYYRNSDYGGSEDFSVYSGVHKEITTRRQNKDWGYTIRGTTKGKNITEPYLLAIRIYSLFNKKFSEYVLLNPIIKDFSHGEHNSSSGAETMAHNMTVEYESVLYAYGRVSAANVKGFADRHYDKRPSPLTAAGGGTQSLFGAGGLAETIPEILTDLQTGNIGSALFKGARVTNGLKGANLGTMATVAALSMSKDILGGSGNNPFGTVSFPSLSGIATGLGLGSGITNPGKFATQALGALGVPGVTQVGGASDMPNKVSVDYSNPTKLQELGAQIGLAGRELRVAAGYKGNPTDVQD